MRPRPDSPTPLDRAAGARRGRIAHLRRRIPLRRVVQALSLLVFLYLFFHVCWPYGSEHHADAMRARERIEAESFLALDPLVSIAAALAARAWVWSLPWAAALIAVCLVIPRGFCSYVCPLGTCIDIVDRAVGRRFERFRVRRRGWWVHLKHYLLAGIGAAALCGVMFSGYLAAMPVLTRGMLYIAGPIELGLRRGWYLVPPMHAGHFVSMGLFALVFALTLLGPRFWCRCVCPTGALLSLAALLRPAERRVKASCSACGKCRATCAFDAVGADFATRTLECTFCRTCAAACPSSAIEFARRGAAGPLGAPNSAFGEGAALSRRGFAAGVLGAGAAALGIRGQAAAADGDPAIVRPPGSVPEREFRRLCVRCGACVKACPFNILQPAGFEHGLENLWTPRVDADWSGCDVTCTNCGQVCPTGAIRALPLEEKRAARMGLAIVDARACLPYAGREECRLCENECTAAGYRAIEFLRVGVAVDERGAAVPGTGFAAPVVLAEKCVGCGLCQTRCFNINVAGKKLLAESAIRIAAGPGREDRMRSGSYRALREAEQAAREKERRAREAAAGSGEYLPDFLK
ncbi:MAG TPA: 4Fe-4S ferredoxin [Planctomycetes bacterium]|nr:4Fe-4S ferredoxin [Planctomycetota bacterium]